ncbi:MAG: hypothetical protein FJ096_13400 [Deltaproteobacteria bacterium]|nr:hypothetical protein [Deltaproteobacteria bacterium]
MKTTSIVLVAAPLCLGAAIVGCQASPPGGTIIGGGAPTIDNIDDDPTDDVNGSSAQTPAAGTENTFDHMSDLGAQGAKDPFEVLAQRQEEGAPEIRTRLHSCHKIRIQTLRNILTSLGVNLQAEGNPDTAGELLTKGAEALGAANYGSRMGESLTWSNSGATKLHDILVQAAPEIIAAMPNLEQCKLDGQGISMFTESGSCDVNAITCLIGKPATAEHVAICNQAVNSATDIEKGKVIAVAAILAAAHTCE